MYRHSTPQNTPMLGWPVARESSWPCECSCIAHIRTAVMDGLTSHDAPDGSHHLHAAGHASRPGTHDACIIDKMMLAQKRRYLSMPPMQLQCRCQRDLAIWACKTPCPHASGARQATIHAQPHQRKRSLAKLLKIEGAAWWHAHLLLVAGGCCKVEAALRTHRNEPSGSNAVRQMLCACKPELNEQPVIRMQAKALH